MITGRDIIYLSSVEWDFLWQGHQEVALRLAAAGNRVLYVENTAIRSPSWRDANRVVARAGRWASAARTQGAREVAPNIHVSSPLILPPFRGGWCRRLNRRLFLPLLLRAARRLRFRQPLVWTYLPNDTTVDLVRQLRNQIKGLVYYCVADFTQLTPHVQQLAESERDIVEAADVVFTNCAELQRKFTPWNEHTHVFPFGVNLDAFPFELKPAPLTAADSNGHRKHADASSPSFVSSLPRPVIGYVGGMHRHVAFGLIREMALRRPRWSWVCVGALQAATRELTGLENVHLAGQRPHVELVDWVRRFDVCVVPYVNNAYTATVVPTKVNEYLAVGKPVVSTALPAVREFNDDHNVLITAEAEPDSFLRAIERALEMPRDDETLMHRRHVAELGDWRARFAAMCGLIEERLRAKAEN